MTQSKESQAREYMGGIERNYPGFCSTFGPCATDNCNSAGRGGGFCASCYEEKLADVVGVELAKEFHKAVKRKYQALCAIMDSIKDERGGE